MLKKRITAYLMTASMMPVVSTFAVDTNVNYIDIPVNSDMFLKTTTNVTKDYVDGLFYYNGGNISDSVIEFDNISYRLFSDEKVMDSKINDVVKVDSADVEISMDSNPAKAVGLIMFTRENQENKTVKISINYENGETESYEEDIADMFDVAEIFDAGLPLEAVKQSVIRWSAVETGDKNVYLNSRVIDISSSVNKSVNLKSITLPATDFTYYVAAVSQVNYSQEELEEITRQNIKNNYSIYADADFTEIADGKDGMSIEKAEELKQSLISQSGKMEEATEENIEKISLLIEGAKLYLSVVNSRNAITEGEKAYLEISPDFDDLSKTSLTAEDYEKLNALIGFYAEYENLDKDRLLEIAQHYGKDIDVEINLSNKEKITALKNAYEKAMLKAELKTEIDIYYDDYISKDISQITADDKDELKTILDALDRAKENGIEFNEYNYHYINHLYNDYDKYIISENGYAIDISHLYNADSIADAGDRANKETWYECGDNISGAKILNHTHTNVTAYDKESGIIKVKEFEYTENPSSATSPYKFTATGYNIPFVMPESGLSGGANDTLLLAANAEKSYTVDLGGIYAQKLYLMMSGQETQSSVKVIYNDGTEEIVSFKINTAAQLVDKIKTKGYKNLTGYITSGDYGNYNLGEDGVIYRNSGNVTNGFGVFAIVPNPEKGVASLSFSSADKNTALYGISVMPQSNENVMLNTESLYNEVVKDGEADITDKEKIAALVMAYYECTRRGLYLEAVDREIMAKLSNMVLTARGEIYRQDKENALVKVTFSVPVNEESAKSALTITADGKKKTDYTVSFNETSTVMEIQIPVGMGKVGSMSVDVASTVKIAQYPDITMMYPFKAETEIKEYITASYTNGTIKMVNNSLSETDYIVYVQAEDKEKIYSVKTEEGSLSPLSEEEFSLLLSAYPATATVSAVVLESDTLMPIYELTQIPVCDDETVPLAVYTKPSFDLKTNIITVNGFSPKKGKKAAVTVIARSGEAIIYCGSVRTNDDGYFCFNIPVGGTAEGKISLEIGGDEFSAYEDNDGIYFSSDSARRDFINDIKKASTESKIVSLLGEADEVLSLSFDPFEYIVKNENLLKKLAKRISDIQNEIVAVEDEDESDVIGEKADALQKLIKINSVLVCIEDGKKDLYSENGALLYDELMKYSSIDTNGVTLYNLFNNSLSDEGKEKVINSISSKSFQNSSLLCDELEKVIMLNALIYPSSSGVGYVEKVLTNANAKAAGINITKYLNLSDKSSATAHIANMNISSLKDVTDYIATLGSDNGGGNSGGGGSSGGGAPAKVSQNLIANAFGTQDTTVQQEKLLFADLPASHWGYNSVMHLNEKGIISGYGDGTFGTDKTITRAEFVKLMCLIKGLKTGTEASAFDDVDDNDWYAPYVMAAYNAGLVNGISDNEFGPHLPVSRQDICVMLYRSENISSDYTPQFADSSDISDYAKEAVGYLSNKEVVNGFENNMFKPKDTASRVQAATIIYNYIKG